MAQRRNYGFERRRKADALKAKQEAKRQRKADKGDGPGGPEMGEMQETGARPDVWEWFSPSRGRTVTTAPGARPDPSEADDWMLLTEVDEAEGPAEA